METLTQKQNSILSFIEDFLKKHSMAPTFQEIQRHFGFASPHAVTKHVRALMRKGYIKALTGGHRGLLSLRPSAQTVPLLGSIAAGVPIEAVENIERHIDLSPFGIDNSKCEYFALHVKGDSMIDAHILDGDMVVIQKQPVVKTNEIAAVLWNGEATLKYVRHSRGHVLLVPANEAMEPMVVDEARTSEFAILGKVAAVVRNQF